MSGFEGRGGKEGVPGMGADASRGAADAVSPGRKTLAEGRDTGDEWIGRGAKCDGAADAGCFLTDPVRGRLIQDLQGLILSAKMNYKLAITDLEIAELIKKDDDLPWVLSLMLDVLSAHLLGTAVRLLKTARSWGAKQLTSLILEAGAKGEYSNDAWPARLDSLLSNVSAKGIETYTKLGVDAAKKQVSRTAQHALNADDAEDKGVTLSYLDRLDRECDDSYRTFEVRTRSSRNDGELIIIWQAMQPDYHHRDQYRDALHKKLDRYKKSGVTNIGARRLGQPELHVASVFHSKRCVWLREPNGSTALYFQDVTSDLMSPWAAHGGEINRVPGEFVDAALAASEAKWGPTPTFDDPSVALARGLGFGPHQSGGERKPDARVSGEPSPGPAPQLPRLQLADIPAKDSEADGEAHKEP